jgi:hypothetical protein
MKTVGRSCLVGLVSAGLFLTACGRPAERPETKPRLDAARLRQLGLTRTISGLVRRACAQARAHAIIPVLCPKLIPDVPLADIEGLWGGGGPSDERRLYEMGFNNAGGYFGSPLKGVEHWIVGGGEASAVEKWVLTDFSHEVPGNAELIRTARVAGWTVRIYRFPEYPAGGQHGSHWAAVVRVEDKMVFASLHGESYIEAAVEMAVDLADQATGTD